MRSAVAICQHHHELSTITSVEYCECGASWPVCSKHHELLMMCDQQHSASSLVEHAGTEGQSPGKASSAEVNDPPACEQSGSFFHLAGLERTGGVKW